MSQRAEAYPAAFNPSFIDSALQSLSYVAMSLFGEIDGASERCGSASGVGTLTNTQVEAAQRDITQALADISSDPMTKYQIVDEALWKVIHMSATVAARHDTAVQDRVDKTTAAVLSALYPHKPLLPVYRLRTRSSLLYRAVCETNHVFGPVTLAMIAVRYDQCFRESELLDHAAMDLFEERYHRKVLDGYSVSTCRPRDEAV